MSDVDWDKEGLLEGLEGDDRDARIDLLEQLHDAGVELDELKTAVEEERLALLPVEQVIGGDNEMTPKQVADEAGIDVDVLRAQWQALGLPQIDDGEKRLGDRDVEAAKQLKGFIDAGLPADGIIGVARVMGEGMSRTVDAVLHLAGQAFLEEGDNERDLGLRYAEAAKQLIPLMEEQLNYVFNLHMREGIRADVVTATERSTGRLPGSKEVAVCFADLVGFTKMGEGLEPEDIGGVAGELAEMAQEVAEGPVRLVKTIGDAAMLVAEKDYEALVEAAIELVACADEAREGFPQLRAGVACGAALNRAGDWYGRPVNIASRVTSVARPGSVLVHGDLRDGIKDSFQWSYAGKRKLKGVKGEQSLYRARRQDGSGNSGSGSGSDSDDD
jgi:adenylate cyclase